MATRPHLSPLLQQALGAAERPVSYPVAGLQITAEEERSLRHLVEDQQAAGDGEKLPVEWVVDVATAHLSSASTGRRQSGAYKWSISTAYAYDDAQQTLHVAMPDLAVATWQGDVPIDPRAVRLIECVDDRSMALFKQVLQRSAIEVNWEVEVSTLSPGMEERHQVISAMSDSSKHGSDGGNAATAAESIRGTAEVYLAMGSFMIFRERPIYGQKQAPLLMNLDLQVTLLSWAPGSSLASQAAFAELAADGRVLCECPNALPVLPKRASADLSTSGHSSILHGYSDMTPEEEDAELERLAHELREVVDRSLSLREHVLAQHTKAITSFRSYLLDGDLLEGLKLLEDARADSARPLEREVEEQESRILEAVQDIVEHVDAILLSASTREAAQQCSEPVAHAAAHSDGVKEALEEELRSVLEQQQQLRHRVRRLDDEKHRQAQSNRAAESVASGMDEPLSPPSDRRSSTTLSSPSGQDKPSKVPWKVRHMFKKSH
eukprot:TRINITY_DN13745_c0_g1_i1.p1 TRINITY_DN13745_c0_g1~~TRINITY_DN13745_c0_g1_i1.p1  ORF type:complete len:518 (-),score=122.58 TRINITY_DN13745_c0_g1_i1:340-1818(-)